MSPRVRFALGLLGFFLVATGVIWRRSHGVATSRELLRVQRERSALQAEVVRLEGAIREAGSRRRIQSVAEERLGMRVPSAAQVIILPRTSLPDDSK
jgi:cell division protein FtsL